MSETQEDLTMIREALENVVAVRALVNEAAARYAGLVALIGRLCAQEVQCDAETVARLAEIKRLEAERLRLERAALEPLELQRESIALLREANGVRMLSVVTVDTLKLVKRRVAQGFRVTDVALMCGLASSTVSLIKTGRYQLSPLSGDKRVGARGRRIV